MGQYRRKLSRGVKWYYDFNYLGSRRHSKCIYHTKKEAREAEIERIKALDEQARNPVNDMKLFDLMTYRLDDLETKKSRDYLRENRRYFKKALKVWGRDIYVSEVSKAMVNNLLIKESKRLKRKGKGNWKVNSMLRSLKALWNYGNSVHDLNLKNPCNLEFFPIDIKTKYIPPAEDIEDIKAECNKGQKLIIEFVDETACRIMEAVRFAHGDIDGDLITLWTRKSRNSNLTPRRIPKPECINGLEGKGKIFNYSRLPRFLERKINKLGQKTWSWHSLRHRRASIWANNGMNLFEISHRLGHSNLKTTQGYLQLLGFTKF